MRLVLAMVIAIAAAGCGGGRPRPVMVPVSGSVQHEGKPIEQGSVTFFPPDGSSVPDVLAIAAGRYAGKVAAGEKRIEVLGMRPAKPLEGDANNPLYANRSPVENYLPSQFNSDSKMVRTITPPGPVVIDLDLRNRP